MKFDPLETRESIGSPDSTQVCERDVKKKCERTQLFGTLIVTFEVFMDLKFYTQVELCTYYVKEISYEISFTYMLKGTHDEISFTYILKGTHNEE